MKWQGILELLQKLSQEKRSTGSDQRIATRICIIASKELLFKVIDLYVPPGEFKNPDGQKENPKLFLFFHSEG